MNNKSIKSMIVGGVMLVVGWLILMAAVIDVIPRYIWLSFTAYALTLVGFVIGIIGVLSYIKQARK